MFKSKRIYIILGIFILLILGAVTVSHAEEVPARADMSKIEFEWTGYDEGSHTSLALKVKNVDYIKGNYYYAYVSHNQNEQFNIQDVDDITEAWCSLGNDNDTIYNLNSIIETKGDIYVWIYEFDSESTPKMVVNAKKIERLEQLPIGERFSASFADDNTYIHCWEIDTERKVNVKIGVVSDKNILEAIKNKQNNGYQKLLEYSKSAKSIYKGTLPQYNSKSVINSLNLVNGEFYYAYFELENQNNKYYPIEDVALYQGYIYGERKDLLDEILWNGVDKKEPTKTQKNGEKEKEDNTTATNKLPYTGMQSVIIASIALTIGIVLITVKLEKYKGV